MQIRNVHAQARQIAATGHMVAPGDTVEVDDELAAALLEQPANWSAVKPPAKPKQENPR